MLLPADGKRQAETKHVSAQI